MLVLCGILARPPIAVAEIVADRDWIVFIKCWVVVHAMARDVAVVQFDQIILMWSLFG